MTHPASPELALTIACCRWPRSPERDAAVREAAASVTDWELFDRLVVRHRVTPLVRDGLVCAEVAPPSGVAERLGARAAECALTTLAMTRESVRLQRAFEAAGVPALIMKGVAVGILAYGDPCMKESWDIDLLTSPQAVSEARSLLESLGYELNLPAKLTSKQFRRLTSYTKEAVFHHPRSGLAVELHWRTMQNSRILSGISVHSPTQVVVAAGAELLTFDDETLFAYLCVHGTNHAWERLKWLADLGAFIEARGTENLARFYKAARDAGGGRTAGTALLLCRRLLGTSVPDSILRELEGHRIERRLEAISLRYVSELGEPKDRIGLPLRMFFSQFVFVPGPRYFLENVWDAWHRPIEMARFGQLAHVLRVPLWLGRLLRGIQDRLIKRFLTGLSG